MKFLRLIVTCAFILFLALDAQGQSREAAAELLSSKFSSYGRNVKIRAETEGKVEYVTQRYVVLQCKTGSDIDLCKFNFNTTLSADSLGGSGSLIQAFYDNEITGISKMTTPERTNFMKAVRIYFAGGERYVDLILDWNAEENLYEMVYKALSTLTNRKEE